MVPYNFCGIDILNYIWNYGFGGMFRIMEQTIKAIVLILGGVSSKTGAIYSLECATPEFRESFIGKPVTSRNFAPADDLQDIIGQIKKAWYENGSDNTIEVWVEIELFRDEYCLESIVDNVEEDKDNPDIHKIKGPITCNSISVCDKVKK